MTRAEIDNIFSYHKPVGTQPERYAQLRDKAKELGRLMFDLCPDVRGRELALQLLQIAVMAANASIATGEGGPKEPPMLPLEAKPR